MKAKALLDRLEDFFADRPEEPRFDPAHLAAALVSTLAAVGILYWLLWTLLVYEGGLFGKAAALPRILSGRAGSDGLEGWIANASALVLTGLLLAALHRLYWSAARRGRQ